MAVRRRPEGNPYARRPWLASYPDHLRRGLDVPGVPLPRLLDDAAERHGDRVALAFLGARTTYAELRDQVDRCAAALAGLGTGRGDRVAVVLPNCPQAVVAWLAALRLGAVVVPLDPLGPAAELGRRLADCGATVALCHDRAYPALASARGDSALRHVVVTSLADALPRRTRLSLRLPIVRARQARAALTAPVPEGDRVRRYADLLRQRGAPPRVDLDAEREVAVLLYTAGTTGPARGALLTHRALVANGVQAREWLVPAPAAQEVVLAGLPLWHAAGPSLCLATCLLLAGTLVLVPRLDGEEVRRAVGEHGPTVLPGTPGLLAELAADTDLTSVRVAVSAGAGPAPGLPERFEARSGGRLVQVYGSAEAPLTHAQHVAGPREPGQVGLPLPGTGAQVVDPADPTRVVPVGTPGELAVTGPQVSVGYWRQPADTRGTVTADGHHLTGDLAVMDGDGVFTVLGRTGPGAGNPPLAAAPARPRRTRPRPDAPAPSRATAAPEAAAPQAPAAPAARPSPAAPLPARRPRPAPGRRAPAAGAAPPPAGAGGPAPRPSPRGRTGTAAPRPPRDPDAAPGPGAPAPSPAAAPGPDPAPRPGPRRASPRARPAPAGADGALPVPGRPPTPAGVHPRPRRAPEPPGG